MADVSRRSVLKSMTKMSMAAAAAPLVPWISGCCRNDYGKVRLNVVLHGLFVLDITDSGLELLTPDVIDHKYRVGGWDIGQIYDLEDGKKYELKETRQSPATNFPKPKGTCAVNITHDKYEFSVNPAKSKFSVKLPFPDDVYLLRCVSAPTYEASTYDECAQKMLGMDAGKIIFNPAIKSDNKPRSKVICKADYGGYPASNCVNITELSLCQVLAFQDSEFCDLKLHGSCWKPYVSKYKRSDGSQGNAVNLHLWAEPEKRTTPKHANEAYAQLQTLLPPLSLNLQVYATAPLDDQETAPGVPREQEQGWADWASGGGEGTRPTNCCTAMVSPKPVTG